MRIVGRAQKLGVSVPDLAHTGLFNSLARLDFSLHMWHQEWDLGVFESFFPRLKILIDHMPGFLAELVPAQSLLLFGTILPACFHEDRLFDPEFDDEPQLLWLKEALQVFHRHVGGWKAVAWEEVVNAHNHATPWQDFDPAPFAGMGGSALVPFFETFGGHNWHYTTSRSGRKDRYSRPDFPIDENERVVIHKYLRALVDDCGMDFKHYTREFVCG